MEASRHWMTSSMPSAHLTRICATPYGTAESSSIPSGMADRSSLYHLPHHEEGLASPAASATGRGRGWSILVRRRGGQHHLRRTQVLVATTSAPAPYRWLEYPITFSRVDQWLNFDHPGKYSLLVDPVIRESRVKKVLVDGGSNINVTFPRTLLGLGVALKDLTESDTPFFGIVPTEGEYPLGHIYMPVTFGTPENYRTEFLRFEVVSFDCGYNTIIGRPGLAKFMAIPHYSYMILKMPGPQGIITVRADFQGTTKCFRGVIQAALTTKPPTTSSVQANTRPEEDLVVPTNEAQAVTSMRPTEETKRIN
jgi:hypothetical protein